MKLLKLSAWSHNSINTKTGSKDVFGNSFVLNFLNQKVPKTGQKEGFGNTFFWSFWVNRGLKCGLNEILKFFEKSMHVTFLIFGIKFQQNKGGLKSIEIIFWGKILQWEFWIKSGPKWFFFFEFYNKLMHLFFLIFYMKL